MGSNAKSGSAAKITLEKFDDLFGGSVVPRNGVEQIINAPLTQLYTFKDHLRWYNRIVTPNRK